MFAFPKQFNRESWIGHNQMNNEGMEIEEREETVEQKNEQEIETDEKDIKKRRKRKRIPGGKVQSDAERKQKRAAGRERRKV